MRLGGREENRRTGRRTETSTDGGEETDWHTHTHTHAERCMQKGDATPQRWGVIGLHFRPLDEDHDDVVNCLRIANDDMSAAAAAADAGD